MILLFLGVAAAQDDSRDDEIFGPSAPPAAETPAPEAPADEAPAPEAPTEDPFLGEVDLERTSEGDISDRLAAAEDRLTLGGWAWFRLDGIAREGAAAEDLALSSPNLLDLFADARPNDRVRVYARARMRHDPTVRSGDVNTLGLVVEPTSVAVDQLWVKGDIARDVFLTVGRQRIKWGAGRFWNPTDFLNQQVLDPLAPYDIRTGVGLLKVHVPFEKAGVNVYAVANVEGAGSLGEVGGAGRIEWLIGSTELTASAAARKDQPLRLGGDLSSALGPFDVHVEGAVQHGVEAPFWRGRLDFDTLTTPTAVDRSDDWIGQIVAGAELGVRYNDEDSLYLGAEGFFNDAGYESDRLYPWLLFQGQFTPFYLGRAYVGVYGFLPGPGRWDDHSFTASLLGNLSDRSFVARADHRATVLTHLSVNSYVAVHVGEGELRFGLEVPPLPGLEDGLVVTAPVLDLGIGAALAF